MDLGKGMKDGGGYDLDELDKAQESLDGGKGASTEGMVDVEPMYITVMENRAVFRTEEYESRMVIIDYDDMDNIIGVELL